MFTDIKIERDIMTLETVVTRIYLDGSKKEVHISDRLLMINSLDQIKKIILKEK